MFSTNTHELETSCGKRGVTYQKCLLKELGPLHSQASGVQHTKSIGRLSDVRYPQDRLSLCKSSVTQSLYSPIPSLRSIALSGIYWDIHTPRSHETDYFNPSFDTLVLISSIWSDDNAFISHFAQHAPHALHAIQDLRLEADFYEADDPNAFAAGPPRTWMSIGLAMLEDPDLVSPDPVDAFFFRFFRNLKTVTFYPTRRDLSLMTVLPGEEEGPRKRRLNATSSFWLSGYRDSASRR